ncbi:MAG TPA: FimV/HubP family polar landmark protein [Gammaproteobacteria bacterium]
MGDIELHSALNQPLEAEIELVSATPEELQGLRVQLAPREAFERYGLERPEFLSSLEFQLAKNRLGRDVVRVTSRRSITEPFVTMLVEVSWPRGRTLREYTVLLDPPVLLPQPAAVAVSTPTTRPAESAAGPITRPAPAPAQSSAPARSSTAAEPAAGGTTGQLSADGTTYGPVQRAETLWAIANRIRPSDVSVNRMMVAIYEANPQAFDGNMNLLRRGAVLRIPGSEELASLTAAAANAEVQRHNDAWRGGAIEEPRVRLLPPSDAPAEPAAVASAAGASSDASSGASTAALQSEIQTLRAELEESRRLLALRDEELRALQERLAAAEQAAAVVEPPAAAVEEPVAAPGVDLEVEQVFAEEEPPVPAEPEQAPAAEEAAPEPVAETPAPAPAQRTPARPAAEEPSFVSTLLGWVMNPILLIGLGVVALALAVVGFIRRRREQEPEDVTGRWDALEQEIAEEERAATERLRRSVNEDKGGFLVEEQSPRRGRSEPAMGDDSIEVAAGAREARPASDETLSSQTVIDLDQADPVAEADFHMAYGLYDQAAELITKALENDPDRRDLKLKLLEVYFVWGNKESFLATAKKLREEMGDKPDADWDKVVIMGKQICPDERLFAGAASAGTVDVDLEAGGAPALDLSFEDEKAESLDIDLTGDDGEEDRSAADRFAAAAREERVQRSDDGDDLLDIGERTAAGLEAALLADDDDDDTASATKPDMEIDSLAVTQESPTVERPGGPWESFSLDSLTSELTAGDAPTVETPTVETAGPDAPTMETPTIEAQYPAAEAPTVEQRGIAEDGTAEIDLDDLGLDVSDLQNLPSDFGDLPAGEATGETPAPGGIGGDSDLLSATGVTQVLSTEDEFAERETAVLGDDDATMLASLDDDTMTGTEVLEGRFQTDETGSTSLVKQLRSDSGIDLDLDDLSAALQGGDTVEQPRGFGTEVFAAGGDTPLDLDVGRDLLGSDDPTGTEEISPLDPQTMTEVGTKLDLARAYIDMGDPEGARSILEEVLDEGDPSQRREAQSLIDALSA